MSTYAVVYMDPADHVESIIAHGMDFAVADDLVSRMAPGARPGYYFTAINEGGARGALVKEVAEAVDAMEAAVERFAVESKALVADLVKAVRK